MFKTKNSKESALHRLKIIRGHLEKVIDQVENDAYCMDVLNQTKAIQSALQKVDEVLLENHLRHCVVDHIKKGETEIAVSEVMNAFKHA